MLKRLLILIALSGAAMAQAPGPDVHSGRFMAANYGLWGVQITSVPSATQVCVNYVTVTLADGSKLNPWNTNASLLFSNGTAQAETVAPTAFSFTQVPGQTCITVASFSKTHIVGDTIISGTFGLQEALNAAGVKGGGAVTIDQNWTALGGTTAIKNAASLPTNVLIEDARAGISAGGSTAFSALTSGTNTTAAMVVGAGASLSSVPEFDVGAVGTNGVIGLLGTTSGKATFTAPAVAGTVTNPIASSNWISVPVSNAGPALEFAGTTNGFGPDPAVWGNHPVLWDGGTRDWVQTGASSIVRSTWQLVLSANIDSSTSGGATLISAASAPTIASGFGTSPSVTISNSSASFRVNVGTGGTATAGVITMPTTALTGWNCNVYNLTAHAANRADDTVMTSSTTTTVSVQNQTKSTGAAIAWTASDIVVLDCFGN